MSTPSPIEGIGCETGRFGLRARTISRESRGESGEGVEVGIPLAQVAPGPLVDDDASDATARTDHFEHWQHDGFDPARREVVEKLGETT